MKSSRDTSFAKYNHFPKKQSRDPISNAILDLLCSVVYLRRYFFRQGSYLYYCRLNLNYLLKGKTRRINLQGSTNFQLAPCASCCTCCIWNHGHQSFDALSLLQSWFPKRRWSMAQNDTIGIPQNDSICIILKGMLHWALRFWIQGDGLLIKMHNGTLFV